MSLPPEANWKYDYIPQKKHTLEGFASQNLKKEFDWLK